jgi:opacity protein-like surface antigen
LFFQPEEQFWANGATFGGGLEKKVDENWTVRAEYRYTNFADTEIRLIGRVRFRAARQT